MAISRASFKAASDRARQASSGPKAIDAHYDRKTKVIVVKLSSGLGIFFSPKHAEGLENATATQLGEIEITPSGSGLHFPKLDADIYVPGLIEGALGSQSWMAARLGAQGGRSRSKPKRAAARANGALGGRPKKVAAR